VARTAPGAPASARARSRAGPGYATVSVGTPGAIRPASVSSVPGVPTETVAHPGRALERARALAGAPGAVLATGSIYLVADLVRAPGAARASAM
jgi:hypothetical protein